LGSSAGLAGRQKMSSTTGQPDQIVFAVLDVISSTARTQLVKAFGLVKGDALPDVGRKIAISSRLVAMKKRGQPDHPNITMQTRACIDIRRGVPRKRGTPGARIFVGPPRRNNAMSKNPSQTAVMRCKLLIGAGRLRA